MASLVGLALALLSRQIFLGGTFYDADIVLQSIPVYSWYSEGLREGRIPLWSPEILGGFPLAFGQYGFFYPPDMLLFWLLDTPRAFHLSLALHLALGGGCCYWYCRVLGLRRLPSLLAAVVFQMGNEVLAWPANGFITKTLFVLPALLATVELTFHRNRGYWLLAPPIVGGALLVGYAQIVLVALALAAVYALVAAAVERRTLGPGGAPAALALLSLGCLLGLGLAAVRVAPMLAVTALSTRSGGMGFGEATVNSLEPWALAIGYLLPAALELPGKLADRPDYVGAPALFLAALALTAPTRLGRVGLFHGGLAVVATILSMGEWTPAYAALHRLPFFSYFRGPNRFSLVAALALAILAAYALDRQMARGLPGRPKVSGALWGMAVAGAAAGCAALALSLYFQFGRGETADALRAAVVAGGWDGLNVLRPRVGVALVGLVAAPWLLLGSARRKISRRALEWSVLGLSAASLTLLGWAQSSWLPPAALSAPPELLKSLQEDPDRSRLFSWVPRISTYNVGAYYQGVVGRPPSTEFESRYLLQFIPPNFGMLLDVSTADGYEALQSRRQALEAIYMGSERTDDARFANGEEVDPGVYSRGLHARLDLLAALNVEYLIHAFPLQDPRLEPAGEASFVIYPELGAEAKVYLYRLKTALPRALVVPGSRSMGTEEEVLEALVAGALDLRQAVILEEKPPELSDPPLTVDRSSAEILEYLEDRVSLRVSTDGSGLLVLMDFLLPGWTATVDGRPQNILAANFAGRAVPIPGPGEHQVIFTYQAPLLQEGFTASLLSLALLAALSLAAAVYKSRRPSATPAVP